MSSKLPDINENLRRRHNELYRSVMELETKLERAARGDFSSLGDNNNQNDDQQQPQKKISKAKRERLQTEAKQLEDDINHLQQKVSLMERHDALEVAIERRETEMRTLHKRNMDLKKKIRENSRTLESQTKSED